MRSLTAGSDLYDQTFNPEMNSEFVLSFIFLLFITSSDLNSK